MAVSVRCAWSIGPFQERDDIDCVFTEDEPGALAMVKVDGDSPHSAPCLPGHPVEPIPSPPFLRCGRLVHAGFARLPEG